MSDDLAEASDLIEKLIDRCARYADEIAVLQERTPEEIDMDHETAETLRDLCRDCDLDRLAVTLSARPRAGAMWRRCDGTAVGLLCVLRKAH